MQHSTVMYDIYEGTRQLNQWVGATAKTFWGNPVFGLVPNPLPRTLAAWGEVAGHAFDRINATPDWGIDTIVSNGRDYVVKNETILDKPFGKLIQFSVDRKPAAKRRILLVAPMSGHHATLLRKTVQSLLPNSDVFITVWKNARDIPVSEGKFDIEDYTLYLAEFMKTLGSDLHVIAVCQPAPLALAATAYLAQYHSKIQPKTLTLIGGPIDPDANPTEVTDFGRRTSMGQLEQSVILSVGTNFSGVGRKVYPGGTQLASFIAMNWNSHMNAYIDQIHAVANGSAAEHDRHNTFYDEYLAVMDMTAEFYLSTVERIYKKREIANNCFSVEGKPIDIGKIKQTAVITVEGGRDDISAPGQCAAALDLLTGLKPSQKAQYIDQDAGHYGIFSGKAWRNEIRPVVLDFIDKHSK